jgi:hypothetical protein
VARGIGQPLMGANLVLVVVLLLMMLRTKVETVSLV